MIDKSDLLALLQQECEVCIHLHGKIPKGALDYRPSPGQRSTLELLRYLTYSGASGVHAMVHGNWEHFTAASKRAETMKAEDFPKAMEAQKRELAQMFAEITPKQFDTQDAKLPTGETMKLGQALLSAPVRWMTAYRMQLFLYAKESGNQELWTANCWAGKDLPRPKPA